MKLTGENMRPSKLFLTSGVGSHTEKLISFELALREARIEAFNLVKVSSIFPPHCKQVSREKGLSLLPEGSIVFVVLAQIDSNQYDQRLSAAVGLAKPADKSRYGYLAEHSSYGKTAQEVGVYTEQMAVTMLAATLGISSGMQMEKGRYSIGDELIEASHISITAQVDANSSMWTTCLSAAVLIE